MRIIYMGNNLLGLKFLEFLKERNEEICGLVIHPPKKGKYVNEIIEVSGLNKTKIFRGNKINERETIEKIKSLKPEIIISVCFGYILKPEIIKISPSGIINLHTGYLPFNRGANPNVWSIVDKTPAGVTLHYIDEGVDTGDIIAQKKNSVEWSDTGKILYKKLEKEALKLFKQTWPKIKSGKTKRKKQQGKGSFHLVKDLEKIDKIELHKSYKAIDLINILRARTFPPYDGAYIDVGGKKYFLRLHIYKKDE